MWKFVSLKRTKKKWKKLCNRSSPVWSGPPADRETKEEPWEKRLRRVLTLGLNDRLGLTTRKCCVSFVSSLRKNQIRVSSLIYWDIYMGSKRTIFPLVCWSSAQTTLAQTSINYANDGISVEFLFTFDFGNADKMLNHHFASSGHVPLTNVTRSAVAIDNEFVCPVTSSAVTTSNTFVMSMLACGIVSGCQWNKENIG